MSDQEAKFQVLRSRAETLMMQSKGTQAELNYRDVQALVHDLSVHQIELEMQNDELQQAQMEMQRVRDEYLKLYNHAPTGYISLDEFGMILKHNQTFATMLGDAALVAVGMSLSSFIFPEDRDILLARFKAFFKSPQGKSVTVRLRRPDGSLSWTQLTGRRDTYLTGSQMVKEVLLLTLSDINSEKQAEKNMADNLRFVSTLLDTIPSAIFYKDSKGRYLGCNQAYTKMNGYSPEELCGKTIFDIAPPDLASRYDEMDRELLNNPGIQRFECRVQISPQEARDFEFFKSTYLNAAGDIAGLICVKNDITERIKSAEELRLARDAADTANHIKSEFLAAMSHEIRTPMNGILGMVQLMGLTELTEEQKYYLNILKVSGHNLLTLINNILDLSKVEAGRVELENTEFCLRSMVNELICSQQQNITNKGLIHRLSIADNIPQLLVGDQLRVKQILLNLLGNAIKFTETGSITISATIIEQYESRLLLDIVVEDTGLGMPPNILEHIFMPFTQGDSSTTRRYGGTGLGLTISRRLAELMGGSIHVESVEGYGSSFHILIPFTVAVSKEKNGQPVIVGDKLWDGLPLRILLVEDNVINTNFGVALLKKMGHRVTTAENGREALDILETDSFDLVLMDIQMPVMNGEEALAILREREKNTGAHQLVIALTAFAFKGNREKFLHQGFDGYNSKPIDLGALINEMKRVIRIGPSESKGSY